MREGEASGRISAESPITNLFSVHYIKKEAVYYHIINFQELNKSIYNSPHLQIITKNNKKFGHNDIHNKLSKKCKMVPLILISKFNDFHVYSLNLPSEFIDCKFVLTFRFLMS